MRTHKVKIGSRTLECATTFKANMLITERVADPLQIARDEMLFAEAQRLGRDYTPQFKMTTMAVASILHAGQEAAGGDLTLDEVGEMLVEAGVVNVLQHVGEYLAALVAGGEEKPGKRVGNGKKGREAGNG